MNALTRLTTKTKRQIRDLKRMWHLKRLDISDPQEHASLVELQEANAQKRIWRQNFPVRFRSDNMKFIHIGKCGGTSIMHQFLSCGISLDEYHMSKPNIFESAWYFIWIRHPLHRFVSAFNHTKAIIDFDFSNLNPDTLSISNCPAPQMIHNRMIKGYAFDPEHDALVSRFSSANEIAESLSSTRPVLARQAQNLMSQPQNHMGAGIGWYLDNGRWVDAFRQHILMVGCLENIDRDFGRLVDKLNWEPLPRGSVSKKRSSSAVNPSELSSRAVKNLRAFYSRTDYAALSTLHRHGLIDDEIYEHYQSDS